MLSKLAWTSVGSNKILTYVEYNIYIGIPYLIMGLQCFDFGTAKTSLEALAFSNFASTSGTGANMLPLPLLERLLLLTLPFPVPFPFMLAFSVALAKNVAYSSAPPVSISRLDIELSEPRAAVEWWQRGNSIAFASSNWLISNLINTTRSKVQGRQSERNAHKQSEVKWNFINFVIFFFFEIYMNLNYLAEKKEKEGQSETLKIVNIDHSTYIPPFIITHICLTVPICAPS